MGQAAATIPEQTGSAELSGTAFPTSDHVEALRASYASLEPALELLSTLFFRRLDEIAPDVSAMMPPTQDERFHQMQSFLSLAVASLDRFSDIEPALKLMGTKFRGAGVTEVHYGAVADALTWTLQQSLGARWTPETADAWTALCTDVAETMSGSQ